MSEALSPFRYKLRLVPESAEDGEMRAPETVLPALDGWALLSTRTSPEGCRQLLYRSPA